MADDAEGVKVFLTGHIMLLGPNTPSTQNSKVGETSPWNLPQPLAG